MEEAFAKRIGITNSGEQVEEGIPIKTRSEQPKKFKTETKPKSERLMVKSGAFNKDKIKEEVVQNFSDSYGVQRGISITPTDMPVIRSGKEIRLPRISPMRLELIYMTEGIIHNWINRIVEYFLSAKPTVICKNESDTRKINDWLRKNKFRELLKLHFQHKYIHGNAAWNWKYKKQDGKLEINGIDFIDPKYFDILRDAYQRPILDRDGNPKAYLQYVKSGVDISDVPDDRLISQTPIFEYQPTKAIMYSPKEIIHFRLNRIGDSWRGIGQIEPSYNFALYKKNADHGYAESWQRVGFPRTVAQVGDKNHPPTSQQIEDVWEALGDMEEKSQFVLPYYVNFKMLESKKLSDIPSNLEYFTDGIVAGLGGPKSLITGLGEGTNRHTLNDQKLWLERSLKMEQEDTAYELESKFLKPLAKSLGINSTPKMKWQEVSIESLNNKTERIIKLVKAGILEPDDPEIRKYIRDLEDISA